MVILVGRGAIREAILAWGAPMRLHVAKRPHDIGNFSCGWGYVGGRFLWGVMIVGWRFRRVGEGTCMLV